MSNKRTAAQVLRNAANLIDEFGWIQGNAGNREVGFCAIGALSEVCVGDNYGLAKAAVVLANDLDSHSRDHDGQAIVEFNDGVAMSLRDVTSAFRVAARALEHGLEVDA